MIKNHIKLFSFFALLLAVIAGIYIINPKENKSETNNKEISEETKNNSPEIISTNPALERNPIVLPDQIIEVTFNFPLIDEFETRMKIEPKINYKLEFINDKRTLRIIPTEAYQIGTNYTLTFTSETKFQNGQKYYKETSFPFRTIDYKGI